MRLLERPVRFGDTSLGPTMHSAECFDLLAVALEELATALEYPFTDVLEAGGTPYAPVDVRGRLDWYPTHGERVVVDGSPVEVGTSSFTFLYVFTRHGDGREYGRVQATHVTIAADGTPEPLPDHVQEKLSAAVGDGSSDPLPARPALSPNQVEGATFSRDVRIRTPHVEAADLAYFEDYFRFISVAFEEFLEERVVPVDVACGPTGQLQPVGWHVSFEDVVPFGATLTVTGMVRQAGEDSFEVQYHAGADEATRIRCAFEYRCVGPRGEPAAVPRPLLDSISPDDNG